MGKFLYCLQAYELNKFLHILFVATPLLEECEDDIHIPEMGI